MDERQRLLHNRSFRNESESRYGNCKVKTAQGTILLTVALERIAFYSLTGNLVLFLNSDPFAWESYNAVYATFFFLGISYLTSFVGGIIADTILGRFKTLLISFIVYIVGFVFLPIITYQTKFYSPKYPGKKVYPPICHISSNGTDPDDGLALGVSDSDTESPFIEPCATLLYGVLSIIAIGAGVYRANIAPFGADQVRREGPQTSLAFFNWYYWSINLGTLVALSAVVYLEQDQSFFTGYLTANVSLGASALIFVIGSCTYIYYPQTGSILKNIFKILKESCRLRKTRIKRSAYENTSLESSAVDVPDPGHEGLEKPPCCLDYAKYRYGGSFHDSAVDDVKQLGKILIVFLTLIPYWMVYFQMQTTFQLQGLHMKLSLNHQTVEEKCPTGNMTQLLNLTTSKPDRKDTVVAAWLTLFDVIFLIFLIPLFDRILYPWLARRGRPFNMITRISVGMFFAIAGVLAAGIVELFRLKRVWPSSEQPCCSSTIKQTIGNTHFYAADMSVFWQVPQYALIGISEVFASIAGLEFAYQMAPKSMKGIIMGLFYLFTGIGSLLGTAIMYAFRGTWFFGKYDFGNINCRLPCTSHEPFSKDSCHLDYYFFFLAGLEFLGLTVFLIVAQLMKLTQHLQAIQRPRDAADLSGILDQSQNRAVSTNSVNRNSIIRR